MGQQTQGWRLQRSGQPGEVHLQRSCHIESGACIGHIHAAAEEAIPQSFRPADSAVAKACHGRPRWRRRLTVVGDIEQQGQPIAPHRVSPMPVRSERRQARGHCASHRSLVRAGDGAHRAFHGVLGLREPRHETQPLSHRMAGREGVQTGRRVCEPRSRIGKDQRAPRFHAALRIPRPFALRRHCLLRVTLRRRHVAVARSSQSLPGAATICDGAATPQPGVT